VSAFTVDYILFGKGVVGLEGRCASLEASPLALGLLGLGRWGRPGRQARAPAWRQAPWRLGCLYF